MDKEELKAYQNRFFELNQEAAELLGPAYRKVGDVHVAISNWMRASMREEDFTAYVFYHTFHMLLIYLNWLLVDMTTYYATITGKSTRLPSDEAKLIEVSLERITEWANLLANAASKFKEKLPTWADAKFYRI